MAAAAAATTTTTTHRASTRKHDQGKQGRLIHYAISSVPGWSTAITLRSLTLILVFIFAILSLNSSLMSVPKMHTFTSSFQFASINLSAEKPFDSRVISSEHLVHSAHATVVARHNEEDEEETQLQLSEPPSLQYDQLDEIAALDDSDNTNITLIDSPDDDRKMISDGIDHHQIPNYQNADNELEMNKQLDSSTVQDQPVPLNHIRINAASSESNSYSEAASSILEENYILPQQKTESDQKVKTTTVIYDTNQFAQKRYIGINPKTPTSRKSHPRNRRRPHTRPHSSLTQKYSKLPLSDHDSSQACDPYIGDWVEDDTYPLYSPESCPFVEKKFDCQKNGRPDSKYTKWRWAPMDSACNMPRFNGTDMLERLRGKRLAFVGDSLSRNQFESLVCMLREGLSEKGKRRISKVHCDDDSIHIFRFKDYDCRVELYTSRYLVDWEEGPNETPRSITLDVMDARTEALWKGAHVLIFNTDHWWGPGKIGRGEKLFKEKNKVYAKLDVSEAYGKTMSTWARWLEKNVNPNNTIVFYRSHSPIHYKVGDWNSGGRCDDDVEPIFDKSYTTPLPYKLKRMNDVLSTMLAPIHYLNVSHLSGFRKDAHPSVYFHPQDVFNKYQDCSHWCLPGLPDTWNELLYFELKKYY